MVGAVTGVGLFLSTTALGFPGASQPIQPAVIPADDMVAVVEATEVGSNRDPGSNTLPSTSTTLVILDPGRDELEAHLSTTTLAGDVIAGLVESTGVWQSGIQLAGAVPDRIVPEPQVVTSEDCYEQARAMAPDEGDANLIAQMTHYVFRCVTAVEAGLDTVDPTSIRRWDGREIWGFHTLADQVAAEAVVVSYCESLGYARHALRSTNPWGYGGLFQLGAAEFRRFAGVAGSRFDPVDNAYAAARYFVFQYQSRAGWGGWSPWAVVNTNFDGVNDQVRIPILPRFTSTDSEFRGRRGPELPAWAVNPWSYRVPDWNGCPYTGGRWPKAEEL
jgi:hypothetical protein